MISASFSLSLPRFGWKSTSTPRSLKICTAAGDSASEMRTLGFVIAVFLYPPPGGGGGPHTGWGGEILWVFFPPPPPFWGGRGWGGGQATGYEARKPLTRR